MTRTKQILFLHYLFSLPQNQAKQRKQYSGREKIHLPFVCDRLFSRQTKGKFYIVPEGAQCIYRHNFSLIRHKKQFWNIV